MIISIDITNIYCKTELSVSHDPSEIILKCWSGAQETFLFTNAENLFFEEKYGVFFGFFDK